MATTITPKVETPIVVTNIQDVVVAPDKIAEVPSGKVAASTATPVTAVSTKAEIVAVKEQKIVNSSEILYTKELQSLFDRINATKNPTVINAINAIKQYMIDMGPGKTMTPETGAKQQVTFFRNVKTLIDYSDNDFQIAFITLLRMFDEFKDGVFSEMYVFRFMEYVVLTPEDRKAFLRILNLLKIAAPVSGRKEAMRQVNIPKSLEYSFTEEGKRKIHVFFSS